jgi:transposase
MPANILNLPCYEVQGMEEDEHDYHIYVEVVDLPTSCSHCQSTQFVGFGRREQMVKDLPIHAHRVGLYVDTRRFRCNSCRKTFYQSLPEVDEKRLMTTRLLQWMGKQAIRRTFASIAEEVGCTEYTVRSVFRDYVNTLEATTRFEVPQWMGIDEIHLIKPRCVISNVKDNTIVEILKDRNKPTVIKYLSQLKGLEQVQYVAMDMWRPYRDAVQTVIPHAQIVIDKFHVVRMANDALERVRKSLRGQLTAKQRRGLMHDRFILLKRERDLTDTEILLLDGWCKNYPELGLAYRQKEDFYAIYELSTTPEEAKARFANWCRALTPEIQGEFTDLIRAWLNWEPYIYNYFNHPVTNAYTESLNNLIRVMNRLGRGYSFEALRAKILFAEGAFKTEQIRPKFNRRQSGLGSRSRAFVQRDSFNLYFGRSESVKNYGVDISTLADMIEKDLL